MLNYGLFFFLSTFNKCFFRIFFVVEMFVKSILYSSFDNNIIQTFHWKSFVILSEVGRNTRRLILQVEKFRAARFFLQENYARS